MSLHEFRECVARHRSLLRRRGFALSTENVPPRGQAAEWFWACADHVPRNAQHVARQLARLCGDDIEVTLPWRSLADAVGRTDKAGRPMAYVQNGVLPLTERGWLEVVTVGRGRGARTVWRLLVGEVFEDIVNDAA